MFNISKFLKKGPDHPMGNIQEARKLLADLQQDNPDKALEELTFWLDSVSSTEGYKPGEQLAILKLLDETAQPFQRKLSKQYLDMQRMRKSQENRLWMVVSQFWKQLSDAYLHCVGMFEKNVSGAEALEKELPLIIVRAMRALAEQNKWQYVRYRPLDEEVWRGFAQLYLFAEGRLFSHNLLTPYADQTGQSSVVLELLQAAMLSVSAPDRLLPAQIDLADKLVAHFANSFTLTNRPEAESMFYLDLSSGSPPARLIKGMPIHGAMRFLSAGTAAKKLQSLIEKAEAGGPIPSDLDHSVRQDELLEVLNTLEHYWSLTPAQRKFARSKSVSRLNVINGFKEIRRKISPMERAVRTNSAVNKDIMYQERVDLKLYGFVTEKTKQMRAEAASLEMESEKESEDIESWVTENISDCGYGVVIPAMKGDWVNIGALLGLKPEGSERWSVGIVRRMHRDRQLRVYLGIQMLAHEPVSVLLRPLGEDVSVWEKVADMAAIAPVGGIILPKCTKCVEESTLLMEPKSFVADKSFEMMIRDEKRRIKLNKLLEEGEGYQRISFADLV